VVMTTKPAARPRAATCPRCEAMKPSAAPSAVPRLSANVYQFPNSTRRVAQPRSGAIISLYITLYHSISLRISLNSAGFPLTPCGRACLAVAADDHRGVSDDPLLGLARAAADATLTPFQRRRVWLRRIECLNCRTIRVAIVPPLSASETP
jgi:hypothetical protein